MALMDWLPLPLKFTVLGIAAATSKVPAVRVSAWEIPSVALADKRKEVPLMTTLYKLAIPLKVAVPVNVAVPPVAWKLPVTIRPAPMVKSTPVVMVPVAERLLNDLAPLPAIILLLPLMVITPAVAV